jgi:hypothetical protein
MKFAHKKKLIEGEIVNTLPGGYYDCLYTDAKGFSVRADMAAEDIVLIDNPNYAKLDNDFQVEIWGLIDIKLERLNQILVGKMVKFQISPDVVIEGTITQVFCSTDIRLVYRVEYENPHDTGAFLTRTLVDWDIIQ